MSDANASGIGQVFGAHERLAAKPGEHQAHQLGAGRFDGETRRQRGRGSEIIYAACFTVSLQQFLNRVAVRRIHREKYATRYERTKAKVRVVINRVDHWRRGNPFKPSRRTPPILIRHWDETVFNRVLMHIIQSGQIRLLVSQLCIPEVMPDFTRWRLVLSVDPTRGARVERS